MIKKIDNYGGYAYQVSGHEAFSASVLNNIERAAVEPDTFITDRGKLIQRKKVVFYFKGGSSNSEVIAPDSALNNMTTVDPKDVALRVLHNFQGEKKRAVTMSEAEEWEAAHQL